jgi:integrase
MGVKVKVWKGAWWVFVNHKGQRKAKRIGAGPGAKKAAEAAAIKLQARLAEGFSSPWHEAPLPRAVTFEEYAMQWLETHAHQVCKFSPVRIYAVHLRRHVFPVLGPQPLSTLDRPACRTLISACRQAGLSPKSPENICRMVSSILSQAVEDGLLAANPAFRLGRYYRRADHPKAEIRPLTREEAALLLENARQHTLREYVLFLCALRTGMRLGELLGLQWGDVDFHGRFIEVRRNRVAGRNDHP